uniref:CobW C-terminal domain-containing protein n=1 Tax=Candidozyma auris TaxID=498019 RepID=A0A0L0P0N8_CANAR
MAKKATRAVEAGIKKPIPVTLLSGFLGSGKTTLLEHILTKEHGLKIAVIINDMSQLNIDADLVQNHRVSQKEEKLVQLQNGCICCTLRGDLLEELVSLAKDSAFEYIIIESTGISEPMQVAETFTTEFTNMYLENQEGVTPEDEKILKEIQELGGLEKVAQLDTCVTVIDGKNFYHNLETTEFLVDRFGSTGQNEEERTICDLMVDQIEFADVIIVNKMDLVSKKQKKKIFKTIKSLNPVAKVIRTNYSRVDVNDVVGTGLFDFEKASSSAGWLQSLHEMTRREAYGNKLTPKPETEEYGINNFVYKSRRPFYPERLYKLIRDKFVVIELSGLAEEGQEGQEAENEEESEDEADEDEDDEDEGEDIDSEDDEEDYVDPSEEQIIKNKKNSKFGPVLRSKGFFWLASRHIIRGEWSSAGPMLTMRGGIPWFAVAGKEFYPPEAQALIDRDMQGKYGDRRNEIVFIGLSIDKDAISAELDKCLLDDEEYKVYEKITKEKNLFKVEKALQQEFVDGFELWIAFDEPDAAEEEPKVAAPEIHNGHVHKPKAVSSKS